MLESIQAPKKNVYLQVIEVVIELVESTHKRERVNGRRVDHVQHFSDDLTQASL